MIKEYFTPGRTELAGNHTDHQKGRILASAVSSGLYAKAEANQENVIRIQSDGYKSFEVRLDHMNIRTREFGTPKALTRGVVSGFRGYGLNIGGFNAIVRSTLTAGSGLSSSAAFGVLIARILNDLFNNNEIEPIVLARIAQNAENNFFGKPCGLMGQLTCALGKTVYVDFKTNEIEYLTVDFDSMGLTLCLTDTGGSHAGLDSSYARIPADMIYIANLFDKGLLCDVDPELFFSKGWDLSNRPVRRAAHFFNENARVPLMRDALRRGDGEAYMRLMNESGRSSEQLLNNTYTSATDDMKLTQGLELSAKLLDGKGAWRVHGGGFAGCVQALMPNDFFPFYKEEMEIVFGKNTCNEIKFL